MGAVEQCEALARELRAAYDLHGAPQDHLGVHIHGGSHEISGVQSIPWLVAKLA